MLFPSADPRVRRVTSEVDIVVLAGGDRALGRQALQGLSLNDAIVVAADSGVALADELGLSVDVAVGDFDSLSGDRLDELETEAAAGDVDLRRHPTDKDAADLTLALDAAVELAPTHGHRVLVAGIEGGRADYALANPLVVASSRFATLDRALALAGGRAWVVDDHRSLRPPPSTFLSMVPVHGPAVVSFVGVRWPLSEATLEPGTTWALSNEPRADEVGVTVHAGTVILFALRRWPSVELRSAIGPVR